MLTYVCVCVCVCVRERETEREGVGGWGSLEIHRDFVTKYLAAINDGEKKL